MKRLTRRFLRGGRLTLRLARRSGTPTGVIGEGVQQLPKFSGLCWVGYLMYSVCGAQRARVSA
ncbi:protein of unknown function [Candidatus Filomicrobium marinum]|nr:protein of unknown function [Candidatus Filomicrobium marinum]